MSGVRVTVTRERLRIPASCRKRANEVLLEANVERVREERRTADGQSLPQGVDLVESGRLLEETSATEDGYEFLVPYAEEIEDRYGFAGLPASAVESVLPKIQAVFDSEDLDTEED